MSETQSTEPATVLLYGGIVLAMDGRRTVLRGAEVLLSHGRIQAVGKALTAPADTRLVDISGCFLLPGLIQGHIHLGQTFFRGLGEGRRLLDWLRQRIWPFEATHDDESAYWCTLQGAVECLLGGTTCVQDIGLGPAAQGYLRALVDSRLRAIAGKCLMDTGDGLPPSMLEETDLALASTEALGDLFDGAGGGRLRYALNPRFILSCSDDLWRGVAELAARRGWPIHTHALEQQDETELVRALKGGRDEIEYFDEAGVLAADLRIAHGVWLDSRHYPRLADRPFAVVHCPAANLKLGSGVADVVGLRRAGIRVGCGCDGAACNNGLDAFSELRLAAQLQQLKHGPDAFSGHDALDLMTRSGAVALGMGDEIGSVVAGKKADLVVLEGSRPEFWAADQADPHDIVAFGAHRGSVRHVFVGGEQLVEDGALAHLDLQQVRQGAAAARSAWVERAGVKP